MGLAQLEPRPEHLMIEASGATNPQTLMPALLELERYQVIRLDGIHVVSRRQNDVNRRISRAKRQIIYKFSGYRCIPLSLRQLVAELKELPTGILKAKGFLSITERSGDKLLLHVTGKRIQIRTIGVWTDTRE